MVPPNFKRSPSHDSFFTSTAKGPSESASDPSSLNQDDPLKPPGKENKIGGKTNR
jgi:hypothetical protein